MSEYVDTVAADRAVKAAHRAMWGMGDYPAVASEVIGDLGPILADACSISRGQRVLDIAAGSGNAALAAAARGAEVVASDLTPELFDAGRARASECGLDIEWREADAESLPFADGEFDAVMSCVGVMFAPDHQACANELVRVVRPGGSVGLVNWTPTGFIGRMFATMKPYAAPPPPGAQPPPLWGDESHVRGLFGDRVVDLRCDVEQLSIETFADPADFLTFFKAKYGPTIAVYQRIAADAAKVKALDDSLEELASEFYVGPTMQWEYLLVTGRRGG